MDTKRKVTLKGAWRESRDLIHRYRSRLIIGFGLMLVSRVAGLMLPASSKFLVDTVMVDRRLDLLVPIAGAVFIATIIQATTGFALSQLLGVAAQRAVTEMRRRVEAHVLRLPISRFDSTQTGILISRIMTDAEGIRNLVGTGLVQLIGGIFTAVVALGVLFWLNWKLTAITLLFLAVFGGGMAYAFKRLRPIFRERSKIYASVTGRLAESLGGIRIVKSYVAERREDLIFTRGIHTLFRNIATSISAVSGIGALAMVVIGSIGALMIVVGGRSVLTGEMTLGDFVMYVFFIGMVAAPLVQIASIGTQVTEAFAGLDRIRELMAMETEDDLDKDRSTVPQLQGRVAFENVNFEYVDDTPVLRSVSFVAAPGTTTALVGSSGSGKSTLMSLVMAFNRPKAGRVLIDGVDLEQFRLREYRAQLGIVLQDNFLFDGTVTENIRFSRPDATMEDVLEVSRIAHCDEFIQGFPEGYDTVVGERGVKLSGGQRQRIAIARAILADPAILLLDEATSSLDSESEALIQDGLANLRRGRTTFVIAHRLSTVISADQILVLEAGEIVERGTHAELLALDGRYKQLYDKQYRLEMNRFINPGEDFTPDLPALQLPAGAGVRPSAS